MADSGLDRQMLAQVRRIQVRTDRMVTDVMAGGYSSVFRGSGIEFDEVREFAEGDDLRSIDWNVTARAGRPFVKKFTEERELTVLLLLDVSASTAFVTRPPDRTDSRSVAATMALFCGCIAFAAAKNQDKVGLVTFSVGQPRWVPAKKGRAHALRIIRDAVATERTGAGSALGEAVDFVARVQRKKAVVFVISDFFGATPERQLRLLAQRHDTIAVRVRDPFEGGVDPRVRTSASDPDPVPRLPNVGLLHRRDLETGQEIDLDTSSKAVVDGLWAAQVAERTRLREFCQRAGIDLLDVPTFGSVADPIVRFFQMREKRGGRR
ncbi:MAG: DUF58 domain-containing protein [Planctomycetes bacterium]|nr:DUF58 domain-containing protein [Planctomycetota bacterium]